MGPPLVLSWPVLTAHDSVHGRLRRAYLYKTDKGIRARPFTEGR
jgi:hypothetical protein